MQVGLKLFNHVNRRLALTSNGEEFLRHCRALVAQADVVLASAQSLSRGKTGVLRIGAAPQTIARFFPSFLQRYERHHPNVRVHLVEASGARQIEMVTKGELHFAITIVFSRQERLANHPLAPIPLLVLSHGRYALDTRSPVDLQRLDGLPLLLGDREQAARATFEAVCRLARIAPNVRFEGNAQRFVPSHGRCTFSCGSGRRVTNSSKSSRPIPGSGCAASNVSGIPHVQWEVATRSRHRHFLRIA
jgi:DNA-binding transcriptional LysR family regulator